jgi:hypothetical protein
MPDDPKELYLLILNGYGSYMTEDFLFKCYINNIFILFLLAYTSHIL